MRSDALLHWMTHVGEGTWTGFRSSVSKLADTDADLDYLCRTLRIFLSDLGHADFFIDGSQRWRVLPPVLGGLAMDDGAAILAGGRTPKLEAAVAEAAQVAGCQLVKRLVAEGPACVRVEGACKDLAAVAATAGVPYVMNYAGTLCRQIVPVSQLVDRAPIEALPGNWAVRSFDLEARAWVEGLLARSACEFCSRYGERRFYLHTHGRKLLRLPKREAIYAAAMIRNVELAEYDALTAQLRAPAAAPLPEAYARAACLCTGAPPEIEQGCFVFRNVPRDTAAILLVSAGQPHPTVSSRRSRASYRAEQGHG